MAQRSCHGGFLDTHRSMRAQAETEPCEHWVTAQSCPRNCWKEPTGIFSSPRRVNSPEGELTLTGCGTGTPQARPQSFYCTKTPHTVLDVPGGQAPACAGTLGCSISVCSPQKRNEKSLGMLQARSLCFRLFSTKRLGNKAHSFPSRESERVHFRKQILKT